MSLVNSTMLPLNTRAPAFALLDVVSGKNYSLSEITGKQGTLIMFICNHCPYVKHVQAELVKVANQYQPQGISCVAINANDVESYPEDSPENMKKIAAELKYPFPYLYDNTQQVARAYQAACTPDFYLFDDTLKCVYRGQLDDSRPGNAIPVTGKDLRLAIEQLLARLPIDLNQKPSIGCNIKWKS